MPTTLPGLLLWGVPGAIVWLVGQILIFRAFRDGHRKSPRGLRLTMVGIGLVVLGWLVALEIAAFERSGWLVAIVIVVVMGWVPVVLFWLATRLTADD